MGFPTQDDLNAVITEFINTDPDGNYWTDVIDTASLWGLGYITFWVVISLGVLAGALGANGQQLLAARIAAAGA